MLTLPNTIDRLFSDENRETATVLWRLLDLGKCEKCGQAFERDATQLLRHEKTGKLAAKCAHCSTVFTFGLKQG